MRNAIIEKIEARNERADLPRIEVGDTVDAHLRIIEGDKERIQVFTGVVIAVKGKGGNRMITVRRIVANEGVERVLPLGSPRVAKIEIVRHGHARRSKLYYLRQRIGKSRRLRARQRGLKHFEQALAIEEPEVKVAADAADAPEAAEADATAADAEAKG